MTTLLRSLALSAVAIGALSAAPLTPGDLGTPKYIKVITHDYNVASGGGQFGGKVANNAAGIPSGLSTKFWCVDSQLYFALNNEGFANIVGINQLPALANKVRYGNIDDTNAGDGDPAWTNYAVGSTNADPLKNNLSLSNAAKDRYLMAAYLVNSYSFVGGVGTNDNGNIQKAIWSIMNNTSSPNDTSGFDGDDSPDNGVIDGNVDTANSIAYWTNRARLNFTSVDSTKWAIVSWLVTSTGDLYVPGVTCGAPGKPNCNANGADFRQTFLVQVVPEPGFYGVLAGGLGILLWGVRRRKTEV